MKQAQFDLRKWTYSDSSIVLDLPIELREAGEDLKILDTAHTIKTLGIVWNPTSDAFQFKVAHLQEDLQLKNLTKREMLSDMAKIFDPLGWLSPTIMKLKQLMQQVWQLKLSWDDQLPEEIFESYSSWRLKLNLLKELKINRFVLCKNQSDPIALHLSCDASELGYAACIYVVSTADDGGSKSSKSNLLVAKANVAPIKTQSIPRLEVCAALLGAHLLQSVEDALSRMHLTICEKHAWTDSTIVLNWLACEPSHWSTFVANRVSKIQECSLTWRHVSTKENPADPASRGLDPSLLKTCALWWNGPSFLLTGKFPKQYEVEDTTEELKKQTEVKTFLSTRTEDNDIIDLSSQNCLKKTIRIVAWVKRFCDEARKRKRFVTKYLSTEEKSDALKVLLRQEQEKFYHDERKTLLTQLQVKKSSSLLRFYPLLFEGILCVGGRLANADLPDEAKYPRIVPEKSELSRLIIGDAHSVTLHGGVNQTMAHIRTKFWIPSCRNQVRKLILNCVGCSCFHATPTLPLMGDLPKERCNIPTRAFTDVGIDFAGPFSCEDQKTSKIYMAIFVCFASKAVHIEAVSDLTTAACVAAFRRFVARRGCPSVIYSDNGTNFNGASSDLQILQEVLKAEHQDSLQAKAAGLNIKWKSRRSSAEKLNKARNVERHGKDI